MAEKKKATVTKKSTESKLESKVNVQTVSITAQRVTVKCPYCFQLEFHPGDVVGKCVMSLCDNNPRAYNIVEHGK